MCVAAGLVLAGVQLWRIGPGPAGTAIHRPLRLDPRSPRVARGRTRRAPRG
jgi:hypothetical protein